MQKSKTLIYFFVGLLLINLVSSATIYGTVYDFSLRKANNARVEINTTPKQFMVAKNGSYSFNVPNGAYTIKAQSIQMDSIAFVEENITTKQDGSYILDLILFPDIEEGVEDIEIDIEENIFESNNKNILIWSIILLLLLLLLLITLSGVYYYTKYKQKKEAKEIKDEKKEVKYENDELEQVIRVIKQEGGRVTQKEIRKQIPLSEAKISLMVAELEHKDIIEKIKKGRGNIIILKKKY